MANNNWSKIVHEVSKTSEFILKKELPYVEPELLTKLSHNIAVEAATRLTTGDFTAIYDEKQTAPQARSYHAVRTLQRDGRPL